MSTNMDEFINVDILEISVNTSPSQHQSAPAERPDGNERGIVAGSNSVVDHMDYQKKLSTYIEGLIEEIDVPISDEVDVITSSLKDLKEEDNTLTVSVESGPPPDPQQSRKKVSSKLALDHLRIRTGVLDVPVSQNEHHQKDAILTVNTRDINVHHVTVEDIEYLNRIMEVAYYSHNNAKVTDVNVRNSKYTKTFDLNLDVQAIMKKMKLTNLVVRPYKMNLYTEGSFFAAHRDTNRPGLAGTLILILPTSYTGGEICFSDMNLESTLPKNKLRFIYFDIGLEHSINKVLSGNRITLVYNVFREDSSKNLIDPLVTLNCVPSEVYDELLREAIDFCKDKDNILFGKCKYRNDVFYKLLKDLEEQSFEVIEVVIEKNDYSFSSKSNDISKVDVVYLVADEDDYEHIDTDDPDLEEMSRESYKVEHVLFPLVSELKEHSIQGYKQSETRYAGNSPEESAFEIECYAAYLINPSAASDDDEGQSPAKKRARHSSLW